ncbi:hypothetical protein ACFL2A_06700, partial [Thermodesulfobacteriota bacterium]
MQPTPSSVFTNYDWDNGDGYGRDNVKIPGVKNTWESNEPKCVDCHDPHGDANDYMIKSSVSRIYGSTDYGTPRLSPASSGGENNPNATDNNLMAEVTLIMEYPGDSRAGDFYNITADVEGDPTIKDGICQVCHTQTKQYRNLATMHLVSLDKWDAGHMVHSATSRRECAVCHTHEKAMGIACEDCHGVCIPNDPMDPMYGAPDYPNAGPGTGRKEATQYYCDSCHIPGKVDYNPPYNNRHNSVCEEPDSAYPVSSNSHIEHMEGGLECKDCHYKTIRDTDKTNGWQVLPAVRAEGSSPNPVIEGYHLNSFGGFLNDFRWAKNYPWSWWNGVHPIELHSEFFDRFGYGDLDDSQFLGYEAYYMYNTGDNNLEQRCFKSCHGIFTKNQGSMAPQWGGSLGGGNGGCTICHTDTEDNYVPRPHQTADGVPNAVNMTQYTTYGHGAVITDTNNGAGYAYLGGDRSAPGCYSTSGVDTNPQDGCHSTAAQHFPSKSNIDPFRLGSYFAQHAAGLDAFCLHCHGEGQLGSALEVGAHSPAGMALYGGTTLDWDAGTAYDDRDLNIGTNTWASNEPKCVDCHDPHGDNYAYMIKTRISRIFGSTDYGAPSMGGNIPNEPLQGGYNQNLSVLTVLTLSSPPVIGDFYNLSIEGLPDGVCQLCHTQLPIFNNIASGSVEAHDFATSSTQACGYCHSHSKGFKATCESCHGNCQADDIGEQRYGAPDYSNYSVKTDPWVMGDGCTEAEGVKYSNSHLEHLKPLNGSHSVKALVACSYCHYDTVSETDAADGWALAPGGPHMDDVVDMKSFENITGDFNLDFNGELRCYKSCHGAFDPDDPIDTAKAPKWGGSCNTCHYNMMGTRAYKQGCFMCHGRARPEIAGVPRPDETPDGIPNIVFQDEYWLTGHGNSTTFVSNNPGPGFDDATKSLTAPGCYSLSSNDATPISGCHNLDSLHFPYKSDLDPYRLGSTYADNTDGLCLYCHGAGQAGATKHVVTHSPTAMSLLTETSYNWNTGTGYDANGLNVGLNTWGTNEPKCVDCHDPHGDVAPYMVKNHISRVFGSTDYGTPSISGGAPNEPDDLGVYPDINLIVPVTFSLSSPAIAGDYYDLTTDPLPNEGVCQICHTQMSILSSLATGDVQTHGFITEAGPNCTACHLHTISFGASCDGCHG